MFEAMFPAATASHDLELSDNPEIVFYSAFIPGGRNMLKLPDGRRIGFMRPHRPRWDLSADSDIGKSWLSRETNRDRHLIVVTTAHQSLARIS
jgi:hypothetical protein